MDKDKLKSLIVGLKALVSELESEVYSDVSAYSAPKDEYHSLPITDYDEIFNDDDYDDSVTNLISNPYRLINDDDGDGL